MVVDRDRRHFAMPNPIFVMTDARGEKIVSRWDDNTEGPLRARCLRCRKPIGLNARDADWYHLASTAALCYPDAKPGSQGDARALLCGCYRLYHHRR